MPDPFASWEKLLNPKTLKQNLIAASVFLTAFELLRDALKEHLRSFFSNEWTVESGWKPSARYDSEVRALDKYETVACAKWFAKMGALSDVDLAAFKEITDHRNTIAHELPKIIGSAERDVSLRHLDLMYDLTSKVDRWWLREIEIPTNPDFSLDDYENFDPEQSHSMRTVLMSLLIQVAQGNDEALEQIYSGWVEMKRSKTPADGSTH